MLHRCSTVLGGDTILSGLPTSIQLKKALYVPVGMPEPGLFDWSGKRIVEGSLFRGIPSPQNLSGGPFSSFEPSLVDNFAPNHTYIYIGKIEKHYGHFLVSTLSRLWHPSLRNRMAKILFTNQESIEEIFELESIAEIFSALGLDRNSFVRFDRPTIVQNVIVPSPSFNENMNAYPAFYDLCQKIGHRIDPIRSGSLMADQRPIYFTKQNLKSGVQRIINEEKITKILAQNGVEIISPEKHSFASQVRWFRSGRPIAGYIGSAFHNAIFAPPGRYLMLSHGYLMNSNQVMIDKLTQSRVLYLHPFNGVKALGPSPEFNANYGIIEPERFAEEILNSIRRLDVTQPIWSTGKTSGRKNDPTFRPRRPMGNLLPAESFAQSVDEKGRLSVKYDLGSVYRFTGVIFNDLISQDVIISISTNGIEHCDFFQGEISTHNQMLPAQCSLYARYIYAKYKDRNDRPSLLFFGEEMDQVESAQLELTNLTDRPTRPVNTSGLVDYEAASSTASTAA